MDVTRSILSIYSTSKDTFFKPIKHASLLSCLVKGYGKIFKKSKQHDEIFANKPTATENSSCFPVNAIPVLDRQLLQHGRQENNPIFRRCPLFTTCDRSLSLSLFVCVHRRARTWHVSHTNYVHNPSQAYLVTGGIQTPLLLKFRVGHILIPFQPPLNLLTSIFKSPTQSPFFTAWPFPSSYHYYFLHPSYLSSPSPPFTYPRPCSSLKTSRYSVTSV
jgi:hypothetical protein